MNTTTDNFAALNLPASLLSALTAVGYETPSPIQSACIPTLLAGGDLLGEAQTGTGKTAAFALPTLARINVSLRQPQALVLAPTRELAIQVAEAFQKYASHSPGFHVLPIYGGQSMVVQLRALSRGPQVIVGTPGRVMDHLKRKSLSLSSLQTLILDEADEMLRMGFIDDVEWILKHTPDERQTALFSATMPDAIRNIAQSYMRNPKHVKIRNATTTVTAIHQKFWQVRGADKLEGLTRILEVEDSFEAAIIFVRTKNSTVDLAERLEARGYSASALNGDMTQGLREQVVDRLKSGSLDIVVATDVAARGLDVPRISHVINYDVPYDTETYVHRIGRTGRAGRTGTAIIFVAPREMRMLSSIERATRQPIESITLPSVHAVTDKRIAQFRQGIVDVVGEQNLDFFDTIVRQIEAENNLTPYQIAAGLAYLAQVDRPLKQATSKDFSGSRDQAPRESDRSRRDSRDDSFPTESRPRKTVKRFEGDNVTMQVYRIEVGRSHGAMPKEIVGAIANEGGLDGQFIGQIDIFDEFSTVELPADLSKDIISALKKARVRHKMLDIAEWDSSFPLPKKTRGRGESGFEERREKRPYPARERSEGRPSSRSSAVKSERPKKRTRD